MDKLLSLSRRKPKIIARSRAKKCAVLLYRAFYAVDPMYKIIRAPRFCAWILGGIVLPPEWHCIAPGDIALNDTVLPVRSDRMTAVLPARSDQRVAVPRARSDRGVGCRAAHTL